MLHGLLLDQSEEFFVKQGPSAGGAAANQEEEEEDLGLGGLSGKQLRELQDLRLIEEENMLAPSLQQFSLRTEMLPSYIPIRVAEKILFVGESVQMFENHNHSPSRAGSILKHQEDLFAAELHRLKQQPLFSLVDFENMVDRIRSTVAEHLWTLMVEESDLLEQLKIIKDFYLLGRGELYQVFIDLAQQMLKTVHFMLHMNRQRIVSLMFEIKPSTAEMRLSFISLSHCVTRFGCLSKDECKNCFLIVII
uniref:Gamma-tubulin complex component n=1 Tax=Acanthochromis polyacanthus TaxID=80966 RepID=A0A3Q1EME6_9TELE